MSLRRYLILPDSHIPFEDHNCFRIIYSVAKDLKPFGLISLGDFGDMLSVSRHPKTPSEWRYQLEEEVEAVRKRRAELDALGFEDKRLALGNHDIRGQKRAMENNIALYSTLNPDKLWEMTRNGWKVYPYQQHFKVGKFNIVHDVGYGGRNAVQRNADCFQSNVIAGHNHVLATQYNGNAVGENHVSCTLGWLGDRKFAKYLAPIKIAANWQHAFGVLYLEKNGNGHLQVHPFIGGKVVVEGKLYT